MRKRPLIIIAVCVLLAGIEALLALDGKLSVPENFYDFGWVAGDSTVARTFLFKNVSHWATIRLLRVQKHCGCTSATLSRLVLAPGEEAALTCTVQTSLHHLAFGTSVEVIWSPVGLPVEHTAPVVLTARVAQKLSIEPPTCFLERVNARQTTAHAEFTIRRGQNVQLEPWNRLEAKTDAAGVQLTLTQKAADEWKLNVDFKPCEQIIGQLKAVITVHCLLGEKRYPTEYQAIVSGRIDSDVRAKPASLYLGTVGKDKEITKTSVIAAPAGKLKVISLVTSDPEFATPAWTQEGDGRITVTSRFHPGHRQEQKSGRLLLTFSDDEQVRQLEIPYMGCVVTGVP